MNSNNSNKFVIQTQPAKTAVYAKADHPIIPCPGFECDRGNLQIYLPIDQPVSPATAFLRCSNNPGCTQKTMFAYGYTKCFECKKIIAKVLQSYIIGIFDNL